MHGLIYMSHKYNMNHITINIPSLKVKYYQPVIVSDD